jgi:hypothetical protein
VTGKGIIDRHGSILSSSSAGEIGHHGIEDQHALRRAADAGIAYALDKPVFQ